MTETEIASAKGIQSVELAMDVLQAVGDGRGPMTLSAIAAASGMQPSKVHRYLTSLCRVGLLARPPGSTKYDLGPAMRRLGSEALRRTDEVAVISEFMPPLRDRTGHSVNLGVWGERGPVVVRWDYGHHALPITVRVGATLPMLTSSLGRVFLTYLPPSMTEALVDLEVSRAGSGWTTARAQSIVDEVRQSGYAKTAGGVIPGVTSLAAPVFAAGAALPLAVSLAMPSTSDDEAVVDRAQRALLDMTAEASRALGAIVVWLRLLIRRRLPLLGYPYDYSRRS